MYCTNSQRPTLFHVLLADIVEICGGSRNLINILNQLGVVGSADTHDRFVTSVSEKQREKGIWESLPENTFSIASVDNFDMLQSHAAVYCGDQQRSYHGTTIQIVQPDPAIPLVSRDVQKPPPNRDLQTLTHDEHGATQCKRKVTHSPASSPHKLGKMGPKRARTVVIRNLAESIRSCNPSPLASNAGSSELTLEMFLEQLEEEKERKDLQSKVFSYMFAKQMLPAHQVLKDLKTLYSENKCKDNNQSNIYYMELLDEHPDSANTMRHVANLLLQNCTSDFQKGYIVLVGDGKTFNHLMKVKHLYGSEVH